METQRLKAKIGEHEFDAEGPVEIVQAQFQAWKELIASTSSKPNVSTSSRGNQEETKGDEERLAMERILRVDGRVVSLTTRPASDAEAALLVLFGHKRSKNSDTVTASELRDGLEHSGYRFPRVDRLMQPLCDEGLVIKIGTRKATRYRLTNPGITRALSLAEQAIAQVA